jgi:hypothetical protein
MERAELMLPTDKTELTDIMLPTLSTLSIAPKHRREKIENADEVERKEAYDGEYQHPR